MYCQGTIKPLRLPKLPILLINTKIPKNTKVQVSNVRALYDEFPQVVQPVLESIQSISKAFQSEYTGDEDLVLDSKKMTRLEVRV